MADGVLLDPEDAAAFTAFWVETSRGGVKTVRHRVDGKKRILARSIMQPPNGMVIDHINGNRLDNRRENLRVCEQSENLRNRKKNKNCASGFKGVFAKGARWSARITSRGQRFNLGTFNTRLEAHAAYCKAANELHGEFARSG